MNEGMGIVNEETSEERLADALEAVRAEPRHTLEEVSQRFGIDPETLRRRGALIDHSGYTLRVRWSEEDSEWVATVDEEPLLSWRAIRAEIAMLGLAELLAYRADKSGEDPPETERDRLSQAWGEGWVTGKRWAFTEVAADYISANPHGGRFEYTDE